MNELDMNVINVNKKCDLTKHKQPKHEGVIYEYYQCECKATYKDNPSKHKKVQA